MANAKLVPVAKGDAAAAQVDAIELFSDPKDPKKLIANIEFEKSRKFNLVLRDQDGRENRLPPRFVLNVLPNRPPELKLLAPRKDVQASPIEEVQLSASAWDDFGLKSFGVHYGVVGQEAQQLSLIHI